MNLIEWCGHTFLVQFNYSEKLSERPTLLEYVEGLIWDSILASDCFPNNFWTKEITKNQTKSGGCRFWALSKNIKINLVR
jgi:hypothetical protein